MVIIMLGINVWLSFVKKKREMAQLEYMEHAKNQDPSIMWRRDGR